MADHDQKILDALKSAAKPLRPGDIAKSLNIDSAEVTASIKRLQAQGKIHSPKRCFYTVKGD